MSRKVVRSWQHLQCLRTEWDLSPKREPPFLCHLTSTFTVSPHPNFLGSSQEHTCCAWRRCCSWSLSWLGWLCTGPWAWGQAGAACGGWRNWAAVPWCGSLDPAWACSCPGATCAWDAYCGNTGVFCSSMRLESWLENLLGSTPWLWRESPSGDQHINKTSRNRRVNIRPSSHCPVSEASAVALMAQRYFYPASTCLHRKCLFLFKRSSYLSVVKQGSGLTPSNPSSQEGGMASGYRKPPTHTTNLTKLNLKMHMSPRCVQRSDCLFTSSRQLPWYLAGVSSVGVPTAIIPILQIVKLRLEMCVNCSKPVWQVRSRFQSSLHLRPELLTNVTHCSGIWLFSVVIRIPYTVHILPPSSFPFFWLCWVFCCSAGASLGVAQRVSCPVACEILGSWPGIKPTFPCIEGGFLTAGPQGKSHHLISN